MIEVPVETLISGDEAGAVAPAESQDLRRQNLQAFGARLDKLFRDQVSEKSAIEERWLMDLRQHSGEYDAETLERIKAAGGSEAFVNLTRAKCNSTEARLSDIILPTDDRNWSIEPTPVPQLREPLRDRSIVRDAAGAPMKDASGQMRSVASAVQELTKSAKAASDAMQQVMDDQLSECQYNAVQRNVLHNAVVYGTGILKGPVLRNRPKTSFKRKAVVDGATGMSVERWVIDIQEDLAPGAESVSPWDFFPDMRATRKEEIEFVFERHRFNKQRLRDLAKLPGFMPEQIQLLLETEPPASLSGLIDQADSESLRGMRKQGRYEVLEYSGPIEKDELVAAGVEVDTADQLTGYQGVVWFCNGIVIKAVLSMLDTAELMYDVMPLERDDTCIFGFGVPYIMRHSQRTGNAAWRMIIDNARLTVGGQVITKLGKIRPVNNDKRLSPLKAWEVTDPNAKIDDVFRVVPIEANFAGMFQILETVRQFNDEETGLPMIAQGQQSPAITKTAQGMSILMNSANTVLRRIVKEFDDTVTSPFIRRLYHWNMQYGRDDAIKGDYCVIALGSSSLLVREQQTQGLMQLAQLAATNPEFARRTKWGDLYRTITRAMSINADGLTKTEDEVNLEAQQAAQQPQQVPPEMQLEMAKLEVAKADVALKQAEMISRDRIAAAQLQMKQAESAAKNENERMRIKATYKAEMARATAALEAAAADRQRTLVDRELALLQIAAERQMSVEQVRKDFGIAAMQIDSKHQLFNAEALVKQRFGSGM